MQKQRERTNTTTSLSRFFFFFASSSSLVCSFFFSRRRRRRRRPSLALFQARKLAIRADASPKTVNESLAFPAPRRGALIASRRGLRAGDERERIFASSLSFFASSCWQAEEEGKKKRERERSSCFSLFCFSSPPPTPPHISAPRANRAPYHRVRGHALRRGVRRSHARAVSSTSFGSLLARRPRGGAEEGREKKKKTAAE